MNLNEFYLSFLKLKFKEQCCILFACHIKTNSGIELQFKGILIVSESSVTGIFYNLRSRRLQNLHSTSI